MYRLDPLTREQRLVAPGRSGRLGEQGRGCPFCAGHEQDTPAETGRRPGRDGEAWSARSFANRWPLTDPHELVVPTPHHVTRWRDLELPALQDGLSLLLERRRALCADGRYVHAFVNDGPAAGASMSHVHAQLCVLDRSSRTEALVRGVRDRDTCALCELLHADALVVERGLHHALVAHPVPRLAGALLLVPTSHHQAPDEAHLVELAELLHRAWLALDPALDANLWLVADEPHDAHWYLELQPRSANLAGLELATALHVSAADPLASAEQLRERLAMRR